MKKIEISNPVALWHEIEEFIHVHSGVEEHVSLYGMISGNLSHLPSTTTRTTAGGEKDVRSNSRVILANGCSSSGIVVEWLCQTSADTLVTPTPAPEQEVYEWKLQHAMAGGSAMWRSMEGAVNHLRVATDGWIDITMYQPGSLIGDPEVLPALGSGILDISWLTTADFDYLDPGFKVYYSMPGVWQNQEQVRMWFEHFGSRELGS